MSSPSLACAVSGIGVKSQRPLSKDVQRGPNNSSSGSNGSGSPTQSPQHKPSLPDLSSSAAVITLPRADRDVAVSSGMNEGDSAVQFSGDPEECRGLPDALSPTPLPVIDEGVLADRHPHLAGALKLKDEQIDKTTTTASCYGMFLDVAPFSDLLEERGDGQVASSDGCYIKLGCCRQFRKLRPVSNPASDWVNGTACPSKGIIDDESGSMGLPDTGTLSSGISSECYEAQFFSESVTSEDGGNQGALLSDTGSPR